MDLTGVSRSVSPSPVSIAWKGFGSPDDHVRPRDATGRPADRWAAPRAEDQDFRTWLRLEKDSITPQIAKIRPAARDVARKLLFVSIMDQSSDVRLAARTLLNRLEESSAGPDAAVKAFQDDVKAANRFLNGYFHRPIRG